MLTDEMKAGSDCSKQETKRDTNHHCSQSSGSYVVCHVERRLAVIGRYSDRYARMRRSEHRKYHQQKHTGVVFIVL